MNQGSSHQPLREENPYASPQTVPVAQEADKPRFEGRRPYPPVVCQLAFVLDLPVSMTLLSFAVYRAAIDQAWETRALVVVQSAYWGSAIVADGLGLTSRSGVWSAGVVAFLSFWAMMLMQLLFAGMGSGVRLKGWLDLLASFQPGVWPTPVQVLAVLLWFGAVAFYRLWYIDQRRQGRLP